MKENNSWLAITVFATSLFTFLILNFSFCLAQQSKLDSLNTILRNATHDTTRASTLVALTEELYLSNPDTVIPLCRQAIVLIEKNLSKTNQKEKHVVSKTERSSFLKIKAHALNNIGYIYDNKGDTSNALNYYHKSLKIQKEIGNKRGIAASLNNIGVGWIQGSNATNRLIIQVFKCTFLSPTSRVNIQNNFPFVGKLFPNINTAMPSSFVLCQSFLTVF